MIKRTMASGAASGAANAFSPTFGFRPKYIKTLQSKKKHLDMVYTLLQQHTRIALMCFELTPEMCYRHIVSDYIARTHRIRSVDIH